MLKVSDPECLLVKVTYQYSSQGQSCYHFGGYREAKLLRECDFGDKPLSIFLMLIPLRIRGVEVLGNSTGKTHMVRTSAALRYHTICIAAVQ